MRSLLFEVIRYKNQAEVLCNSQSIMTYQDNKLKAEEQYIVATLENHTEQIINIIGGK